MFATERHRTVRTKGSSSSQTAKQMVFKLIDAASKTWRRLRGIDQFSKIIAGVRFVDGMERSYRPRTATPPDRIHHTDSGIARRSTVQAAAHASRREH